MTDYEALKAEYQRVHELLFTDIPIEDLKREVEAFLDFTGRCEGGTANTYEEMLLTMDIQVMGIEYLIKLGDSPSYSVHAIEFFESCQSMLDGDKLTTEQKEDLDRHRHQVLYRVREALRIAAMPAKQRRKPTDKCLLCRLRESTKTNSHLIPRLFVQQFFNIKGGSARDQEVVEVYGQFDQSYSQYFGRDVNPDRLEEHLGMRLFPEELARNEEATSLTEDYVFCDECERRFSVLESWYAETSRKHATPPAIAYLYWTSVVWRMSIIGMGIKLTRDHEAKLRKILHKSLALDRKEIVTDPNRLGHCAYSIDRCQDTRDETLGIWGFHEETIPYIFMIGNCVFRYYMSETKALSDSKKYGLDPQHVCRASTPETVGDINFLAFWTAKRQIFDENRKFEHYFNFGERRVRDYARPMSRKEKAHLFGDKAIELNGFSLALDPDERYSLMMPRSIKKIQNYMEQHPYQSSDTEKPTQAEIESRKADFLAAVGYTEEEVSYMLDYWSNHTPIL